MAHRSLLAKLRILFRIRPETRRDLIRAQLALLRAKWSLGRAPNGTLVTAAVEGTAREIARAATPTQVRRAREIAVAVVRTERAGLVRAPCLARAIAIRHLIQREGLGDGEIRVGVRMSDGRLEAHAWVDYGGVQLVTTRDELQGYVPLDGLEVTT